MIPTRNWLPSGLAFRWRADDVPFLCLQGNSIIFTFLKQAFKELKVTYAIKGSLARAIRLNSESLHPALGSCLKNICFVTSYWDVLDAGSICFLHMQKYFFLKKQQQQTTLFFLGIKDTQMPKRVKKDAEFRD